MSEKQTHDGGGRAAGPYSYEKIFPDVDLKCHWRVRDADDNRVATCYIEDNAKMIVEALNRQHRRESTDAK